MGLHVPLLHSMQHSLSMLTRDRERMKTRIIKAESLREFTTNERCHIAENYSSERVSIARARVSPGVTTRKHHLKGVDEVYLIAKGRGRVEIDSIEPTEVETGDAVFIPPGSSQRITNIGKTDLIFYCICTPKFTPTCYRDEERQETRA